MFQGNDYLRLPALRPPGDRADVAVGQLLSVLLSETATPADEDDEQADDHDEEDGHHHGDDDADADRVRRHVRACLPSCNDTRHTTITFRNEGRKEMFYLMMHLTHFLFMVIWQTYAKGPLR